MANDPAQEERLKLVQDGRVYPVGRVLRETFDANNHDSLSSDVTGLMLDLSKLPYEEDLRPAPAFGAGPARSGMVEGAPARGLLGRLGGLFGRR